MFERILVPVDGSATSRRGLDEAIAMARLTGARIRLFHAFDPPLLAAVGEAALMRGEDIFEIARGVGRQVLAEAAARVKAAGVAVDKQLQEPGSQRLCEQVAEAATAWKASLIVVGSHGRRGLSRMVLGSDAEQILRTAPVPVLLVRDSGA